MINDGNDFRNFQIAIVRMRIAFRECLQRTLRQHGINVSYETIQVLSTLWREEGIPQQVLAARTAKGKAALSSLMNILEEKGYIERREDPADRRNKLVYLTPQGRAFRDRILPLLNDLYARLEGDVSLERIRLMTHDLTTIQHALENA